MCQRDKEKLERSALKQLEIIDQCWMSMGEPSMNWNVVAHVGNSKLESILSAKQPHSYGKSPFDSGKTHYKWSCSIAM